IRARRAAGCRALQQAAVGKQQRAGPSWPHYDQAAAIFGRARAAASAAAIFGVPYRGRGRGYHQPYSGEDELLPGADPLLLPEADRSH
ncbi:hypothetical protein ABTP48_19375, partial [Acinetobacter baumannii]